MWGKSNDWNATALTVLEEEENEQIVKRKHLEKVRMYAEIGKPQEVVETNEGAWSDSEDDDEYQEDGDEHQEDEYSWQEDPYEAPSDWDDDEC